MVKAYLRYEAADSFGVISTSCNVAFDASGKRLLAGALEAVNVWNVKKGTQDAVLRPPPLEGAAKPAEANRLAVAPPPSTQAAVGYDDGTVRLWDTATGDCLASLSGHRSQVTALRYNDDGSQLASGSKDTDIILWDTLAHVGLYKLRGHRDQVTDLAFVARSSHLVSSSKDSYMRVWDLNTQHCCQTIVSHKGEVWALALSPDGTRLLAGSTDPELKVFSIEMGSSATARKRSDPEEVGPSNQSTMTTFDARSKDLLSDMGAVARDSGVAERVERIVFDAKGGIVLVQSAGKALEVFRMRSEEEARKKMKRRRKRKRAKLEKDGGEGTAEDADEAADEAQDLLRASDELVAIRTVRVKHKLKSIAIGPKPAQGALARVALGLANNSIELIDITDPENGEEVAMPSAVAKLDLAGHRAGVRALALSSDDGLLLSTSAQGAKLWNPATGAPLRSIQDAGYGLCAIWAPGDRHAVVGTKEGALEVLDIGASTLCTSGTVLDAHTGAVWSLAPLPDGSGFVSGGADGEVKFWAWALATNEAKDASGKGRKELRLALQRSLKMSDDVLSVRVSKDGALLAVALLDATVKVFHADSLKFFLSLYGHKLPVLCMDISDDSTLLVTGSADKNIKIWGLDFGDCHKSLFAHGDSVMATAFVPGTHYVFTAGKDRSLKYWDADKFELLLELHGHHAEVWAMAVTATGDAVFTAGHDRSLRRWARTEEPFFLEEEAEKRLDSLFEEDAPSSSQPAAEDSAPTVASAAAKGAVEATHAADALIDALEMARHEAAKPAGGPINPLMLGMSPNAFVAKALANVRAGDLEAALLSLPFGDALALLGHINVGLGTSSTGNGRGAERAACVVALLLRLHHAQLIATPRARPLLLTLRERLRGGVQGLKDSAGRNLAALQVLSRRLKERAGVDTEEVIGGLRKQVVGNEKEVPAI